MQKVKIIIMPKDGILDPQGKAINQALNGLGFSTVEGVRVGKVIDLEYDGADLEQTRNIADEFVKKGAFFNPIMESYKIEVVEKEPAFIEKPPRPPIKSPRPSPPPMQSFPDIFFTAIVGAVIVTIVILSLPFLISHFYP